MQYVLCRTAIGTLRQVARDNPSCWTQRHKSVDALMECPELRTPERIRDKRMEGRHRSSEHNNPTFSLGAASRACPDRSAGKGRYRPPNRPNGEPKEDVCQPNGS
ncbi:MAG: hypothetical protein QOJ19_872 [Acidimicrobiia bacterium]|nr:hypothetical protein [Acidimicrobiia bacterium]